MKSLLLLLASVLTLSDDSNRGACLQSLPPDGIWVEYNVTITVAGKETLATWKARSVGQTTHEGQACRWIELQQASESVQFPNMTWRLLIPEREFGEGKHPLGHAKKFWLKREGQDAETVTSIESVDPIFNALTRGPIQDLEKESSKEKISWQNGDLECEVVAGGNDVKFDNGLSLTIKQRVFRNTEIPFGFAGFHAEIPLPPAEAKQVIQVRMTLKDHGKNAEPQHPQLGL